ncbi:MAG: DUF305 domain-containing protein [Gemmatimonadales bacterium]|nr:DUF305 domain-containing protein [Gemmatimonadales bacterium]
MTSALIGIAVGACNSKPDPQANARSDAGGEVAASASDTMSPSMSSGDTAMTGMGGMDSAGNPDQQFLRMMSDHHKGILLLAHDAIGRTGVSVKPEAQKIDKAQDAEVKQMVAMLKNDFKDDYTPKVMKENQSMADALTQKSGEAYDITFRKDVIKHHEAALQMIDRFLPQLTKPALKQMAQKMKKDQTREIAQFKRELGQS